MGSKEHSKRTSKTEMDPQVRRTDSWLPEGRELGDQGRREKGFRSTDRQLLNSHRDVKHSVGNTASNSVITVHGARQVLEISGGMLCTVCDCLTTMLYP